MHASLDDRCSFCPPSKRHGIGGPLLLAVILHAALLAWPGSSTVTPDVRPEVRLFTTLVAPSPSALATPISKPVSVVSRPTSSAAPASAPRATSASPAPLKTTADSPRLTTLDDIRPPSASPAPVAIIEHPDQAAPTAAVTGTSTQALPTSAAAPATTETAPMTLADLNVVCPQQTAPTYPLTSRRLHETGQVVLKIALDDSGRIITREIRQSSGSDRLDRAALDTVKNWRCNPARRDGQAVAAIALQRFEFALQ